MGLHPRPPQPLRHCAGELVEVVSFLVVELAGAPDYLLWVEEVEGAPCLHQEVP